MSYIFCQMLFCISSILILWDIVLQCIILSDVVMHIVSSILILLDSVLQCIILSDVVLHRVSSTLIIDNLSLFRKCFSMLFCRSWWPGRACPRSHLSSITPGAPSASNYQPPPSQTNVYNMCVFTHLYPWDCI